MLSPLENPGPAHGEVQPPDVAVTPVGMTNLNHTNVRAAEPPIVAVGVMVPVLNVPRSVYDAGCA